jgi:hypothetical protein
MLIYITMTDQYPKGFSDLVKTMECNGMNLYVQFCLCMNISMLGLKRKYANSYGILLRMPFFDDDDICVCVCVCVYI